MSYRDDLEAAQARIDALEQEKAELVEEAKQARGRGGKDVSGSHAQKSA
jgi:uncharacterized protein (UPF0335 family)